MDSGESEESKPEGVFQFWALDSTLKHCGTMPLILHRDLKNDIRLTVCQKAVLGFSGIYILRQSTKLRFDGANIYTEGQEYEV